MTDKKNRTIGKIIWFAVMILVIAGDQISKNSILSFFGDSRIEMAGEGANTTVIPKLLDFTLYYNDGATAGILSDRRWVFMSVSSVIIIAIIVYLVLSKKQGLFGGISLSLIVGGGIGNMIDRIAYGKVVDFIDVTASDIFPFNTIFNVADVCVCVGCALLVLSFIIDEVKEKKGKGKSEKGTDEVNTDDTEKKSEKTEYDRTEQ